MKTSARQIAGRYVKALFETADQRERDQVEKDFFVLNEILAESAEFRQLLTNPLLQADQQAAALTAILKKINAGDLTQRFLSVLAAQKRLPLLAEVISIFSQWASTARGELQVEVVSASALKLPDVKQISDRLKKAYGKDIAIKTRTDSKLLGGVVVKIGSVQLDGSLSGKLRRLKNMLKAA